MSISLRPLAAADAQTSVHWRNDPAVWQHTAYVCGRRVTLADEQAWIARALADGASRRFAIEADGVYVGNVSLTGIDGECAELHIFIGDRAYWGRGIAKAASSWVVDHARQVLRLKRLTLGVKEANSAALAIYTGLGFVRSGHDDGFTVMTLAL